MDYGRKPLARFPSGDVELSATCITLEALREAEQKVSQLILTRPDSRVNVQRWGALAETIVLELVEHCIALAVLEAVQA